MGLINDINELRETVKISVDDTLYKTLRPYIADATDRFIRFYLGDTLVDKLENNLSLEGDLSVLRLRVRRALGPFSVALATHELGILIGESGHTVAKTETRVAASDNKVDLSCANMMSRGWAALDGALAYVAAKDMHFMDGRYFAAKRSIWIQSVSGFENYGLIDIGGSNLTYDYFRMDLLRAENEIKNLLPAGLFVLLENMICDNSIDQGGDAQIELVRKVRMLLAALVVAGGVRSSGTLPFDMKWAYVPTMLYKRGDLVNYYVTVAKDLRDEIKDFVLANGEELGVPRSEGLQFNGADKKIFVV